MITRKGSAGREERKLKQREDDTCARVKSEVNEGDCCSLSLSLSLSLSQVVVNIDKCQDWLGRGGENEDRKKENRKKIE